VGGKDDWMTGGGGRRCESCDEYQRRVTAGSYSVLIMRIPEPATLFVMGSE
jgi:hypothetical protein